MSLIWTVEQRDAIRRHAETGYPNEICGILIGERQETGVDGDKIVREVIPVENAWEDIDEHHKRFLIAPEVLLHQERRLRGTERQILGFYHSHPDHPPEPSETDREFAWPSFSYLIQQVENGRAVEALSWVLKDDRSAYDRETIMVVPGDE